MQAVVWEQLPPSFTIMMPTTMTKDSTRGIIRCEGDLVVSAPSTSFNKELLATTYLRSLEVVDNNI